PLCTNDFFLSASDGCSSLCSTYLTYRSNLQHSNYQFGVTHFSTSEYSIRSRTHFIDDSRNSFGKLCFYDACCIANPSHYFWFGLCKNKTDDSCRNFI